MAVKSAEVSASATLQKEKEVLCNVLGCPNVVHCFGEEVTVGRNGEMFYNLLLEFASAGTLASLIKECAACGGSIPESDVRRYTRAILRGLDHIHGCGYVHCDMKPENVLLVGDSKALVAKIADFGLAKRAMTAAAAARKNRRLSQPDCLRGTVLYISPEAVADGEQEPAADIWSLGCVVLEMLTGKPAWGAEKDLNRQSLLSLIGSGLKLPEIPGGVSKEARDFLKGCLVRKPMFRWTAEMLLNHPFVSGIDVEEGRDHQRIVCDDDSLVEEEELAVEGLTSMNRLLSDTDDESGSSSSLFWGEESSDLASSSSCSLFNVVDDHHRPLDSSIEGQQQRQPLSALTTRV